MDTGSCNEAIFMLTLPQMEINIWEGFYFSINRGTLHRQGVAYYGRIDG